MQEPNREQLSPVALAATSCTANPPKQLLTDGKQRLLSEDFSLPAIPGKTYFTIGETALLCRLKPHVLRYWEQEFPQLKPNKRCGNRRYYQEQDILLLRRIKTLLYNQGFTIEGARSQLKKEQRGTAALNDAQTAEAIPGNIKQSRQQELLQRALHKLEDLLGDLQAEEV